MSLDVYVMPIWRFKVGDFTTPIEKHLRTTPKIVSGSGVIQRAPRPSPASFWRRLLARREVRSIRRAVAQANGRAIRWSDEGEVVYNEQGAPFEALRAYAKWRDYRDEFPDFDRPPKNNFYKHPIWKVKGRDVRFPHLVQHDCHSGYFLPCEFEKLTLVEPFRWHHWTFRKSVGSTPRLLGALEEIAGELEIAPGWVGDEADPLSEVKYACSQLMQIARLSVDHQLPIIFWG